MLTGLSIAVYVLNFFLFDNSTFNVILEKFNQQPFILLTSRNASRQQIFNFGCPVYKRPLFTGKIDEKRNFLDDMGWLNAAGASTS